MCLSDSKRHNHIENWRPKAWRWRQLRLKVPKHFQVTLYSQHVIFILELRPILCRFFRLQRLPQLCSSLRLTSILIQFSPIKRKEEIKAAGSCCLSSRRDSSVSAASRRASVGGIAEHPNCQNGWWKSPLDAVINFKILIINEWTFNPLVQVFSMTNWMLKQQATEKMKTLLKKKKVFQLFGVEVCLLFQKRDWGLTDVQCSDAARKHIQSLHSVG